ncbi:hypothetical protein, partial [Pyrobaculum sp.]|uniref:hypothetical protein n=1 Tax=Pyrobaculum sp. TaxID=2004705 RepID=UPI003D0E2A03
CSFSCSDLFRKYRDLPISEIYVICRQRHLDQVAQSADCTEPIAKSERCAPLPMVSPRRVYYPRYFFVDREKAGHLFALIKAIYRRYAEHEDRCFEKMRNRRGEVDWFAAYICTVSRPQALDWRRVGRAGPAADLRREVSDALEALGGVLYRAAEGFVYSDAVVLFQPHNIMAVKELAAAWLLFGGVYTPWPPTYVAVGESAYRFAKALLNLYKAWESGVEELRRLGHDLDSPKVRRVPEMYSHLAEKAEGIFDDFAAELLTALQLWGHPTVVTLETGIEEYKTHDIYWRNIKK